MSGNPYMLNGFQQGFLQGLDVIYRDREFKRQEKFDEYRVKEAELGLKTGEANLERERVGLRRDEEKSKQESEKYEYEKTLRPMQEQNLRNQSMLAGEQAASMRESRRKMKMDTDQRERTTKAQEADVHYQKVFSLGSRVAQNIRNPQYLEDGEAFDAFANGGMLLRPGENIDQLKQRAGRFLNMTYSEEINKGVGEVVDAKTAQKLGVPKGTKIVGKEIVDFYIEGDSVVIELDVKTDAKQEDGSPFGYKAPMTQNRSSSPTDEVLKFPLDRMQEIASAGGSFAEAFKLMKESNPNIPDDVLANSLGDQINAALAAGQRQMNPRDRFKVVDGQLVDVATKRVIPIKKGISPDQALKAIRGVYDKYATSVGAENVDTNQVLAEASELIAGAQAVNDQASAPVIKTQAEYNELPVGAKYIAADDPEQKVRTKTSN